MRIDSSGNVGIGTSSPDALLSVNGVASFGDGTALLPSIANFGDLNTGMWFPAADTIAFSEGGAEAMRIDSGGNVIIGSGGLDASGIGGTFTALNIRAGSGYPAIYGQTTATATNKTALNIIGATSGASAGGAAEMLGAMEIACESDSSTNATGFIRWYTGSGGSLSERMRISSSGNVSIGTTNSTLARLYVSNDTGDVDDNGLYVYSNIGQTVPLVRIIQDGAGSTGEALYVRNDGSGNAITVDDGSLGNTVFVINQNGNIQIGTTTESARLHIASSTTAGTDPLVVFSDASGTDCGSIDINASANTVAYTTSSDYRLKENVDYNFDATSRLKQLKPARFNFIADANTTVDGFLAHEVSNIVPEAITGTKDATKTKEKVVVDSNGNVIAENIEQADWETGKIADEDGNTKYPTDSTWEATKVVPVYQGIDQSKLVPLLVKTIQELEARITALETTN
jgi:hypothetical protein